MYRIPIAMLSIIEGTWRWLCHHGDLDVWEFVAEGYAEYLAITKGEIPISLPKPKQCTPMGSYLCQVPMAIRGRRQDIDYCIADIVAALNAANIITVASCCGHGDETKANILLEDGRQLWIENVKV